MIFNKQEKIEILEALGYTIQKSSIAENRKSKVFGKKIKEFILIDEEELSIDDVMKMEIKKRLFNL